MQKRKQWSSSYNTEHLSHFICFHNGNRPEVIIRFAIWISKHCFEIVVERNSGPKRPLWMCVCFYVLAGCLESSAFVSTFGVFLDTVSHLRRFHCPLIPRRGFSFLHKAAGISDQSTCRGAVLIMTFTMYSTTSHLQLSTGVRVSQSSHLVQPCYRKKIS